METAIGTRSAATAVFGRKIVSNTEIANQIINCCFIDTPTKQSIQYP